MPSHDKPALIENVDRDVKGWPDLVRKQKCQPDRTQSLVVDFFVFLRERFRLSSFHLNRYIGLPDLEYYKANNITGHRHTRLKAISDFVCHEAAFPFPGAAEVFGHQNWAIGSLSNRQDSVGYDSIPPEANFEWKDDPDYASEIMKSYEDESWSLVGLDEDDDRLTVQSDNVDDENGDFQPPRTESECYKRIELTAKILAYGYVEDD